MLAKLSVEVANAPVIPGLVPGIQPSDSALAIRGALPATVRPRYQCALPGCAPALPMLQGWRWRRFQGDSPMLRFIVALLAFAILAGTPAAAQTGPNAFTFVAL